jgi:hypothetical protein
MTEIIKDPDVPRETRLPSVAGREEPVLNSDEKSRIDQLLKYAHGGSSKMNFDVIFSLTILAAYLRYPKIEGLGDELLPEGPKTQPIKKGSGVGIKTSRSTIPGGKRSKISSDVLTITTNKSSQSPRIQLSLPKEMAFPRKSRYDKGKNKANPSSPEDPQLVDSVVSLRTEGRRDISTIFDLLADTRPSREVSVPVKRNNPLIVPSRDMTLIAEGSNSLIPSPLEVLHPPLPSSATDPPELLTTGAIQEDPHPEAETMEPSASDEMDKSGAFTLRPDFMEDDEVTGCLRGHSTDDQFFPTNPNLSGPSNS